MEQSPYSPLNFDRSLAQSLCDLEVPKQVKFSPNGKLIIYSARFQNDSLRKGKHCISTLWLATTSEAGSARRLTSGEYHDIQPTWFPDGKRIAFLSDRGNRGKGHAIWCISLEGGDAVQISPDSIKENIASFSICPDGKRVAFISSDERTPERIQKEADSLPDPKVWGEDMDCSRLRLVDLETQETKTLSSPDTHVLDCTWNANGDKIAYTSTVVTDIEEVLLTGVTISTIDTASGTVSKLTTPKCPINHLVWAPDGKIYFVMPMEERNFNAPAVYVLDPTDTALGAKRVLCGELDNAAGLTVAGSQVIINRQVRHGTVISDLDGRQMFQEPTDLKDWDVYFNRNANTWTLAAAISSMNNPHELFAVQTSQESIKLSNHGKSFEGCTIGSFNVLTSLASDGKTELDGLYLTPATATQAEDGKPASPLPTFVLIHGGPNYRNFEAFDPNFKYWAPYLVSKGYGVLVPQYRGGYGRGNEFTTNTYTGHGKDNYDDVISMTQDSIDKGFADKERIVVGGWSHGGLLSYLCSVRNGLHGRGWSFKAAIPGAGICDSDSAAVSSDLGSTIVNDFSRGVSPWTCVDRTDTTARVASALWEVAKAVEISRETGKMVIPPMLILHGESDARVPVTQGQGFRRALRHHGLPHEFVTYPGAGHSPEPQSHWIDMLERIERWCYTYIGPGERCQDLTS